jgi:hypothetical protein
MLFGGAQRMKLACKRRIRWERIVVLVWARRKGVLGQLAPLILFILSKGV